MLQTATVRAKERESDTARERERAIETERDTAKSCAVAQARQRRQRGGTCREYLVVNLQCFFFDSYDDVRHAARLWYLQVYAITPPSAASVVKTRSTGC